MREKEARKRFGTFIQKSGISPFLFGFNLIFRWNHTVLMGKTSWTAMKIFSHVNRAGLSSLTMTAQGSFPLKRHTLAVSGSSGTGFKNSSQCFYPKHPTARRVGMVGENGIIFER